MRKNNTYDKNSIIGIVLIVAGTIFNILETIYFGLNAAPQSAAELVCDIISQVMIFSGFFLILGWSIGLTIKTYLPGVQVVFTEERQESNQEVKNQRDKKDE